MTDEVPKPQDLIEALKNERGRLGGLDKFCTDAKRCGMGMTCEFAQIRDTSVELLPLYEPDGADYKGCKNWTPRLELRSENDIFRPKGRPKHNPLRRSNLIKGLKQPDLMTKRHLRGGRDIKEDE